MKINWIKNIGNEITKKTAKTELVLKKKSPEILLGFGIVGIVGTVVIACKATLRADEVLEYHYHKMNDIHTAKDVADQNPADELEYDDKLYRQDIAFQYLRTAGSFVKIYAPAITLGTLSIACIITSRNIMQKRYLGVMAAYNGLSTVFDQYRKRVIEEYGENLDKHFRYGTTFDQVIESGVDENGKKVKTKVNTENTSTELINPNSDTCRWFDSSNPNWDRNPVFSMMFLRGQQNYLNDLLHTRGHVFLNEVYDALGFPHTPQGAVLGWIEGVGDDYIDFGLYDPKKDDTRRYVNGMENVVLLEFNHDGVIWDKI